MTELTPGQERVFLDRYALDGETKPEQMWRRISQAVAKDEQDPEHWENMFYELLEGFKYVPGGRINQAMGNEREVTAMNCYTVASPEDSRQGIMHTLAEWTEIQSKGGGVGVNISSLRPRGTPVGKVGGTSSGPVNWAQIFTFISHDIIIQGGSRRGAAMICMDVSHPDIQEFIHAKETPGVLEGANVSVAISEAFMEAVRNDFTWNLQWGGKLYKKIQARDLWNEICEAAWKSGEPGVLFMERANIMANSGYFETFRATNPCSEQFLGDYGACLLGSFNLMNYVSDGNLMISSLEADVRTAVRFNDNIIDLSHYPLQECEDSEKSIRRMGIGIMGMADALITLELRYGSEEAQKFVSKVYETIRNAAYEASSDLAVLRGSFAKYDEEQFLKRPFIRDLPFWLWDKIRNQGIRNCYLLTQAPTGSTAMLSGVNSGIEPYFDFSYLREDRIGNFEVHSQWADAYESADRPDYLVTSQDISVEDHILMQAAAQRYVDSAISKTINAPKDHTLEETKKAYMMAYEHGLKSVAYYRDGSRDSQVLYHKEEEKSVVVDSTEYTQSTASDSTVALTYIYVAPQHGVRRRLPDNRLAKVNHVRIDGEDLYIFFGLYEDGTPGEVWINMSKTGTTLDGVMKTLGIALSVGLQYGVPLETLVDKYRHVQYEPAGMTSNPDIPFCSSITDYIAQYIKIHFIDKKVPTRVEDVFGQDDSSRLGKRIEEESSRIWEGTLDLTGGLNYETKESPSVVVALKTSGSFCPVCSRQLVFEEGCQRCVSRECVYYKC